MHAFTGISASLAEPTVLSYPPCKFYKLHRVSMQTALWGQKQGNNMLTMPVIMQACCSTIWGLRELLQSAGKWCIQMQASVHPLLDRDVLSYQICGCAAACIDAAGLKLVVGSQDTFMHSKIQRWQQRHTYRDFDHVGDKGTSHHTCKEA